MEAPKKPELPKRPEVPKRPEIPTRPDVPPSGSQQAAGRSGETRSRLGWKIYCSSCGYINGTTNYEGARKSALDRLRRAEKVCPECGATSWDSAEIFD